MVLLSMLCCIILVVIILPVCIKCLTEVERIDEWHRRGNVWPPQWQPGTLVTYYYILFSSNYQFLFDDKMWFIINDDNYVVY
jgi:hypothetical protein